ncbi:MAG: hypothetical protein ACJA01_001712 [Saprospiraceae bacterium]|jgi:hypothetical protein
MIRYIVLVFGLIICLNSTAQRTVGVLSVDSDNIYDGYNLIYPHNQSTVFLLDNCGEVVHDWVDLEETRPGNSVYLLESGAIAQCKRRASSAVNDPIWAGGGGETVEIKSWDNDIISRITINNDSMRFHHDIAPMPNGNILLITWRSIDSVDCVSAGRDPSLITQGRVWTESILEWNPQTDAIVWEWHIWDHLIQDLDPNQKNYGIVGFQPERVDFNYDEHDAHPDWLHINAIDYNPVLDQIVVSVPYFNEFWIIDHSTTTQEARSSTGGNSEKGGDLLYRWGNPKTYQAGTDEDQRLFFQHDVHWINPDAENGDEDFGVIGLFNNRLGHNLSPAHTIPTGYAMLFDSNIASYDMAQINNGFMETRIHPDTLNQAYSAGLSSMQVLPNDNWLICAGRWGYVYELNPEGNVVWEYVVPFKAGQVVNQGVDLGIGNNITFRAKRFPLDYPAFEDRVLEPGGVIEIDDEQSFCNLIVPTVDIERTRQLKLYPNPATNMLYIEGLNGGTYRIVNNMGELVREGREESINLSKYHSGIYFLEHNGILSKFLIY